MSHVSVADVNIVAFAHQRVREAIRLADQTVSTRASSRIDSLMTISIDCMRFISRRQERAHAAFVALECPNHRVVVVVVFQ